MGGLPTVSKAGSAAAQQPCPAEWQHPPAQPSVAVPSEMSNAAAQTAAWPSLTCPVSAYPVRAEPEACGVGAECSTLAGPWLWPAWAWAPAGASAIAAATTATAKRKRERWVSQAIVWATGAERALDKGCSHARARGFVAAVCLLGAGLIVVKAPLPTGVAAGPL
jgi:hypothetical protein